MEHTEIKLHKNNTCLSFFVDEDFGRAKYPMFSLTITDGYINKKEVFWDNIDYFFDLTFDEVAECTKELIESDQYYDGVFSDIEYLINRAKEIGYLK